MTIFPAAYRAKYQAKKRRASIINPWDRILASDIYKKEAQKLAQLRPIPTKQRGAAWFRFLNAGEVKRRHAWLFEFLVQVDSTVFAEKIDRDVTRTLGKRDLSPFEREERQNSLRRILLAYSNLDASLGYCQGMNFIAAHILDHISDEADAFWMFVAVLRRTRNLFLDGLKGFFQATAVFDKLFKQILPDLHAHFIKEKVVSEMFLTSWFHTLFVLNSKPSIAARIWDNFLLHGSEVAVRFAMAYLIILKDELMQMNIIEIVTFLKQPPVSKAQLLVNAAFSFQISRSFAQDFECLNEEYPLSNYFQNMCWFHHKSSDSM